VLATTGRGIPTGIGVIKLRGNKRKKKNRA